MNMFSTKLGDKNDTRIPLGGFFKWSNDKDEINYCMEFVIANIDPLTVAGTWRQFIFGYFNTL